jgi:hypothetical protein
LRLAAGAKRTILEDGTSLPKWKTEQHDLRGYSENLGVRNG